MRSDSAFPDEFVESTLISSAFDGLLVEISRADGFVSLLSSFRLGVVLTRLDIFGTIILLDFLLGHTKSKARQVDRVGTHIGNLTGFVELLGDTHCVGHRETKFAGRFLL